MAVTGFHTRGDHIRAPAKMPTNVEKASDLTLDEICDLEEAARQGNAQAQQRLDDAARADGYRDWDEYIAKQVRPVINQIAEAMKRALESYTREVLAEVLEVLRPGTFLGDIALVAGGKEGQTAALERLAQNYFRRRVVFHPARWYYLDEPFRSRIRDGSRKRAYVEIISPALFEAIRAIPKDLPVDKVFPHLRREVRKAVERDLLDGLSLDEYITQQKANQTLPDEDTPEVIELEKRLVNEFSGLENVRIDVLSALMSLDQHELEALLADDDDTLAQHYKVKAATIRKRRERARTKFQKLWR